MTFQNPQDLRHGNRLDCNDAEAAGAGGALGAEPAGQEDA